MKPAGGSMMLCGGFSAAGPAWLCNSRKGQMEAAKINTEGNLKVH